MAAKRDVGSRWHGTRKDQLHLAVCGVRGGQERRPFPPITASMVFLRVVVELGWGAGGGGGVGVDAFGDRR